MDASTWATVEEIFRDLLIFVAFMTVLLVALVVIISMLPADNPLKRTLTALSYRVGATAAVGALAIPIEPIPDSTLSTTSARRSYSSGTGTRFSEIWVGTSLRRQFSKSLAIVDEQCRES